MDTKSIFRKQGEEWTQEEIKAVFDLWLTDKMVDQLIRFAFRFTKDLALAKDVVQEKLKDAYDSIKTYDPTRYQGKKCPFRNWIYCMLARAANRKARQAAHRQIQILQAQAKAQQQQQQLLASRSQRASELEWEEVQERLDELLAQLQPDERQAIISCEQRGLSPAEAARKVGCSEHEMEKRLFHARSLRDRLMTKGESVL